jgi:hypothetical protein
MITADSDYFLLQLKPSTIPNAGIGVFAKADIPEGVIIAEYRGAIFLSEHLNVLTMNDRGINLNQDAFIAGNNCVAGFINDIVDFEESQKNKRIILIPGLEYNCFYKRSHHKMFVITQRDIKEGEELFVEYGNEYWNSRINQDEQHSI